MKNYLFKFEAFLLKNGIVSKEDIKSNSLKTRQNNLVTLSDFLKLKSQTKPSSKISSLIYDSYIDNDDIHIKSSIRRLIPIYARRLRIIKTNALYNWYKFNRKRKLNPNMQIQHVNSAIVSNRLYEDYKDRWNLLRDLEMKYQSIEAQDCTFSPRINQYYRPMMRHSKSYSKISIMKIDDPPMKKRRKSANHSMTDLFNNQNLIEKYHGCGYVPDRSIVHYPTYCLHRDIEPMTRKMKTINVCTTSNRDKDTLKTLFASDRHLYSTKQQLNLPATKYDQSKARLIKGSNESTEEDTRKALKSKDKGKPFLFGSKELAYLHQQHNKNPNSNSNKNNNHFYHNAYPNLNLNLKHHPHCNENNNNNANNGNGNNGGNQITLQSLSDSKLLHIATHYITTDESFEKFKWNMIK